MSQTLESGAYLGGIGAMLQVSHVCPSCGQVHEGRKYGFKHRAPRECPLVVTGNFPVVSLPASSDGDIVRVTAPQKSPRFGIPSDGELLQVDPLVTVQAARVHETARSRGLGVPWLPPPDLGEVL
jgi:hypothetical protein